MIRNGKEHRILVRNSSQDTDTGASSQNEYQGQQQPAVMCSEKGVLFEYPKHRKGISKGTWMHTWRQNHSQREAVELGPEHHVHQLSQSLLLVLLRQKAVADW